MKRAILVLGATGFLGPPVGDAALAGAARPERSRERAAKVLAAWKARK